jgi:hypothetical protein
VKSALLKRVCTSADLDGAETVASHHLAEALSYPRGSGQWFERVPHAVSRAGHAKIASSSFGETSRCAVRRPSSPASSPEMIVPTLTSVEKLTAR